jgi:hypothetical protein
MTSPVPVRSLSRVLFLAFLLNEILATTVQDVRLELVKEDTANAARGVISPHKTSLTTFLTVGMDLEEQQCVYGIKYSHL